MFLTKQIMQQDKINFESCLKSAFLETVKDDLNLNDYSDPCNGEYYSLNKSNFSGIRLNNGLAELLYTPEFASPRPPRFFDSSHPLTFVETSTLPSKCKKYTVCYSVSQDEGQSRITYLNYNGSEYFRWLYSLKLFVVKDNNFIGINNPCPKQEDFVFTKLDEDKKTSDKVYSLHDKVNSIKYYLQGNLVLNKISDNSVKEFLKRIASGFALVCGSSDQMTYIADVCYSVISEKAEHKLIPVSASVAVFAGDVFSLFNRCEFSLKSFSKDLYISDSARNPILFKLPFSMVLSKDGSSPVIDSNKQGDVAFCNKTVALVSKEKISFLNKERFLPLLRGIQSCVKPYNETGGYLVTLYSVGSVIEVDDKEIERDILYSIKIDMIC